MSKRPTKRFLQVLLYAAARNRHQRLVFMRADDGARVLTYDLHGPRTLTEPDFTEHPALLRELANLADAEVDEDGSGKGELLIDVDEHGRFRAKVAFDPGLRGEGRATVELARA